RDSAGQTLMELGRYEEAIEHFERAAQLLDTDHTSLGFVAQCHRAVGQHDESMSAARRKLERIEKEITVRPDNAYALVHGAVGLAYLGERERAKEWASRAFTIEPDDPIDHYNLACALAQLRETDEALNLLESCVPKTSPEMLSWIKSDLDLIPLHDHPRFQR